jgi:DNA-binding MarR family transcriptional regulator
MEPAAEVGTCATACPSDLGWALSTVLRAHVRTADLVLEDLPGGARAYRLLVTVAEQPLPTQLALAEATGLDRTVVTYLLDGLVTDGLVERRADPRDRRARRIVLTDVGASRLEDFRRRLDAVERHVLGALDEQEAEQLRSLLERTARAVRGADPTTCEHVAALAGAPTAGAGDC